MRLTALGTKIFGQEDLLRLLRALASAGEPHGAKYRQALHDVGLAVGVELSLPTIRTWYVVEPETAILGQHERGE